MRGKMTDPASVLIAMAVLWGVMLIVGVGAVYWCLWRDQKRAFSRGSCAGSGRKTDIVITGSGERTDTISVEVDVVCCPAPQEGSASVSNSGQHQERACPETRTSSSLGAQPPRGTLSCSEQGDVDSKCHVTVIKVAPCPCHTKTGEQPEEGEASTGNLEDSTGQLEDSTGQWAVLSTNGTSPEALGAGCQAHMPSAVSGATPAPTPGVSTRKCAPRHGPPPSPLPPVAD